ncbi:hypothetical protein [Phenylobacterium sp.]|uniref:hypothetical protein n=1 Tax=Phenylobacterium sp. TaxID=1871053 RepID=UPI00286A387F|nr:hypothetical protein [Phenylobacterium sp.]
MSRDNHISINAGRDVRIDAMAVGDNAQAAAGTTAQAAQLAASFAEIRAVFDRLESAGQLTPDQGELLRADVMDAEQAAVEALKDERVKENLTKRLKRVATGVQSFCKDQNDVWRALESVASLCAIPMALLGVPKI